MITRPSFFGRNKIVAVTPSTNTGEFSFTLTEASRASIGVYKLDGTLVRTLITLKDYPAGTHKEFWNGKDDYGVLIATPQPEYEIKIVSSNIQYTWDGTIGNSSRIQVGDEKHKGYYRCAKALAITSTGGYYACGYPEGGPSIARFSLTDPQVRINLYPDSVNTGDVNYNCTDGTLIYWAGYDPNAQAIDPLTGKPDPDIIGEYSTFIFATKASDNTEYPFPNGVLFPSVYGRKWPGAIAVTKWVIDSEIMGLSVQKAGNLLFVSRPRLNTLEVYHKTSGALIVKHTVPSPTATCADPITNHVWRTSNNVVTKHTVDQTTGVFSAPLLTLSGLEVPVALQISPDGTKLGVCDAGTSHQVKFFNPTTGALISTLGVAGSYSVDATVTNNKFFFNDIRVSQRRYPISFLSFESDGSFWVGDPGCFRVQHYSASNVFINRIAWLGSTYRTWVDKNDISRVFSDFLEFSVDYTSLATGGGWSLVKNWGFNLLRAADDDLAPTAGTRYEYGFISPMTYPNGRTYAFLRVAVNNSRQLVELPKNSGTMRMNPTFRVNLPSIVGKNTKLFSTNKGSIGGTTTFLTYPLATYDVNGWPVWSTVADSSTTTPILTINDPNDTLADEFISSTNKIVVYNPDKFAVANVSDPYIGYHLGAIKVGANQWLWKTERANHIEYLGPYPNADRFDIGNGVNHYAGSQSTQIGRHTFTQYHGEFWKNLQTNYYHHFLDSGLAVGLFGTDRQVIGGTDITASPKMAGNSLTPCVVQSVDATKYYIYNGDESDHSGIHRWSITNLESLREQSTTILFPTGYLSKPANYFNIMGGLPFNQFMTSGVAGWVFNPVTFPAATSFYMKTNYTVYDEQADPDIRINFTSTEYVAGYTISKDIGVNNVSNSWEIAGKIGFNGADGGGTAINVVVDILDANGRIIANFFYENKYNDPVFGIANRIYGNGVMLDGGIASEHRNKVRYPLPITIIANAGVLTMKFNDQPAKTVTITDPTANWRTPTTFRIKLTRNPNLGPGPGKGITMSEFKLYKDHL